MCRQTSQQRLLHIQSLYILNLDIKFKRLDVVPVNAGQIQSSRLKFNRLRREFRPKQNLKPMKTRKKKAKTRESQSDHAPQPLLASEPFSLHLLVRFTMRANMLLWLNIQKLSDTSRREAPVADVKPRTKPYGGINTISTTPPKNNDKEWVKEASNRN